MPLNDLDRIQIFAVALPFFAMLLLAIAAVFSRLKQLIRKPKRSRRRRRFALAVVNVAMGLTFLPFAAIYRPSLIEVAKAQIRQQEDADEDDNGDPETPLKHLLSQLRRIRRGEKVETLFLRWR
jgi:predicted PurR-regulated permease PerM